MSQTSPKPVRIISNGLWWALLVIVVGLPFHVLVYSLLLAHASSLSGPFRNWKEALVCIMAVAAAATAIWRRDLFQKSLRDPIAWLITGFVLLNVIYMPAVHDTGAAVLAVKINVVFLLLFMAVRFIMSPPDLAKRQRSLIWALLIPSALVGIYGLLQLTVLPQNFLTHFGFGFGPNQIQPLELIQESTIRRAQSFLFGPNQLGSYLALPTLLAVWLAVRKGKVAVRLCAGALSLLLLYNLYGTQSRGSWVGVLAGLVALLWLMLLRRGRIILSATVIVLIAVFVIALPALSRTDLAFQLRHSSPQGIGASVTSDQMHLMRLNAGTVKLLHHPFGEGLGAAGRASDLTGQSFFTENFYLQIGDQIGWLGLVLFVAIVILLGWRLYRATDSVPLAVPLLATLVALSVMNFFSHTWSDGATALLWWGAAGAILPYETTVSHAKS